MVGKNILMTFKRYEKKYLLTRDKYERFREEADRHMQVDEFGLDTINNIYYDTRQYDMIRESIEKPVYKEKLRLRGYGNMKSGDTVYLELKKKYNGIVYKRRAAMKLEEAYMAVAAGHIEKADTQILRELDYVLGFYKPEPKVYLAYDRIALFDPEGSDLRMTFDFNIRYRTDDIDMSHGDYGKHIMADDSVMLEIKASASYPFWLIKLLEKCEVYPVSFSKYGTVYGQLLNMENNIYNSVLHANV